MMNNKKECFLFKASSVVYMWIAFGCGFIAWLMMFCPALNDTVRGNGPIAATSIFFPSMGGVTQGAWPAFIGYMLVIFAMLANGILALPFVQPSAKTEKIVLFSSLGAEFVGLVLVSLISVEYCGLNGSWTSLAGSYIMGGTITFIVFDVLMMAATGLAIHQDW